MALYVCHRCIEEKDSPSPTGTMGSYGDQPPSPLEPIRRVGALLGSVLGGLLGLLSGNPVLVLLGASVGSYIATASQDRQTADGAQQGVCDICETVAVLKRCAMCGEWVCPICREVIMAQEEREGRRVYRHYEMAEIDDEPGALALAPWYLSDQLDSASTAGYRLSEEAFEVDEESGELIPVPETESDESPSIHNSPPTDEWDFDAASVSPAFDDWGGSDAWSSMDSDDGNREAGSADSEGG